MHRAPVRRMIDVRPITDPADMPAVDHLYRTVFDVDTGLNARLLTALAGNGGQVTGAYDGDQIVGFGAAFLGRRDGVTFLYSQTVAVHPDRQGDGVGRLIKHGQRAAALADGMDELRWVFDPVQARNAHVNLDVLGARLTRLERDYYGPPAYAGDHGERTDRVLVRWPLRAPAPVPVAVPEPASDLGPGETRVDGADRLIGVPTSWRRFVQTADPGTAANARTAVVDAIAAALGDGLVGVSCHRTSSTAAAYTFRAAASTSMHGAQAA